MRNGSLLEAAGVDIHVQDMISDTLHSTWFSSEWQDAVVGSKCGTRPGDPLPDMLFGFIAAEVDHKITLELRSLGLINQLPWNGSRTIVPSDPLLV